MTPANPARAAVTINPPLVIVDEVGYTPIDREQCNLFFRFIANRYEKASTIITSNKAFSDWAELFHDHDHRNCHIGSAAAPQRGDQHQGQQPSAERKGGWYGK
jgi:DNA replication protein DnaC